MVRAMRVSGIVFVAVGLLTAELSLAHAQSIDPATRPIGGVFGSSRRSSNDSSAAAALTLDLGGGYDQNSDPIEGPSQPIQVFTPQQSGYIGNAMASLQFRRGTTTRFIESSGRAYISHASAGASRVMSGTANLRGATRLSPRGGMAFAATASYDPTFLFNAFGAIDDSVEGGVVPGSVPTRGVTEQRWIGAQGSATLYQDWTPRQQTTVQYAGQYREPMSGPGLSSRTNTGTLRHKWNVREHTALQFSYNYNANTQQGELGQEQVFRPQTGEVALTLTRPLAPERSLAMTIGGGVSHAFTERPGRRVDFVVPVISGSARLDLTPDWSVEVDSRRDVSILDGLSPEPFLTNTASVRSLILFSDRVFQLSLSGAVSRGAAQLSETGSFRNVVGTVQIQYAVAPCCAIFTNYGYYHYRIVDVSAVQPGFPDRYELQSVRVGLRFWLPVYGRW